jgi:DegV family protein with EDD domain
MIAIVTDSTIGIPRREAERLQIHVVPNSYSVNNQTYLESYIDGNGDFERRIFTDPERWKTSQASVSSFMQVFEQLLREKKQVLCLTMSSRLSGTFSSACIAAREIGSSKIVVVDSLSTAGALLLMARKARSLAEQGLTLQQIAARIRQLRERTGIAFSVDSMAGLRRSGRLGIVPQSVGTILNIRPILMCVKGTVVARALARGNAGRMRAIVETVPRDAGEILVHHLGVPAAAEALYQSVKQRFASIPTAIYRLGPVLGVHLGAGAIGVSWICE